MLEAIMSVLSTMGWLGIVLGILVIVNTICGTIHNVHNGEAFSWKKMLKGVGKSIVFYVSAALTSVAFTILPYINEMVTSSFGVILLSADVLNTLSSVAVLGVVIGTVVIQAKKALTGICELANVSADVKEEITWEVKEDEE